MVFARKFSGLIWTPVFYVSCITRGVAIGRGVKCYGRVIVRRSPGSVIKIGNNVTFMSDPILCTSGSVHSACVLKTYCKSAVVQIGSECGFNGASIVARSKKIKIGEGTMFAPNCRIIDSDFHAQWPPENRLTNPDFQSDKDVFIGSNVWLGTDVLVMRGVEIGDNSVVGARSVVTGNIPSNSLALGAPAKTIRKYV